MVYERYCVGQSVTATMKSIENAPCETIAGKVVYPTEDGRYLIKTDDGAFAMVDDAMIIRPATSADDEHRPFPPDDDDIRRVVVFANGTFALPSLDMLRERYDVVAIVTNPDVINGENHVPSPVVEYARLHGIPVYQPRNIESPRTRRKIMRLDADLGIVADYKRLPPQISEIPRMGCIALHPSLLPSYKGSTPISTAILKGETLMGVTAFSVGRECTDDMILNNMAVETTPELTASEIGNRLAEAGARLLADTIGRLDNNALYPVHESCLHCDFLKTSFTPGRVLYADRVIPWHKSANEVADFIRAMSLHGGARTYANLLYGGEWRYGMHLRIESARRSPVPKMPHHVTGEIVAGGHFILVACGDGLLAVDELSEYGTPPMPDCEFLQLFSIAKGYFWTQC